MKDYIIKVIKEKIEENKNNWARDYVTMKVKEAVDTPEAKKMVEAAKVNLDIYEKNIKYFEDLLQTENQK